MFPDDFVAYLDAAASESGSILHQYNLEKMEDRTAIFAFFEGDEDKLIYTSQIKARAQGRKIYNHICDGKDGVLQVFSELQHEVGDLLFFVDRDYDEFMGESNDYGERVFVTRWYSAESYLCTEETINILWDEFVPLPRDRRLDALMTDFVERRNEFFQSLRSSIAWAVAMMEAKRKILISDLKIKKIVEIDVNLRVVRSKSAMEELMRCHKGGDETARPRTFYWAREFNKMDPLYWVRGKYISWFVGEYISKRWVAIQSLVPKGKRKAVIPIGVQQNRLFETFGARLLCSVELANYLDLNLKNAVEGEM